MAPRHTPRIADWRIADGVRVEELDGTWLALDATGGVVYRLEALAAEAVAQVAHRMPLPARLVPAARELAGHGVLEHPLVDRRTALVGAGVVTLTGLAATLLPAASAAASDGSGSGGAPAAVSWTGRTVSTTNASNAWTDITHGTSGFVAVAQSGTGSYVIRSADGLTWSEATGDTAARWMGVAFGQPAGTGTTGRFVAVGFDLTTRAGLVMTSDDGGANWTSRTPASTNEWQGVTYGAGVYVAVAGTGSGDRVMTSADGITWTSQTSASDSKWNRVAYGGDLFVAVAGFPGETGAVMTSTDGTTWTSRTVADRWWTDVTYGDGTFVAVARSSPPSGTPAAGVMTSSNGVTWTERTAAAGHDWTGIAFGAPSGTGIFAAVAQSGATSAAMTSTDGTTWATETTPDAGWNSVAYGDGVFVAVAITGRATNQVMTRP
jgi:hypothetical protein